MELYLLLSDECNFSCGHCVASCGPQSRRYQLSSSELTQLACLVNEDSSYTRVHFSGGEPSIQIKQIIEIQSKIVRDMKYAMTTNGSFGATEADALRFFDQLRLDEIFVSVDHHHLRFITVDKLINVVRAARSKNIKVNIRLVYDSIEDIALAKPLLIDPTVNLMPSGIMRGGRHRLPSLPSLSSEALEQECPSLDTGPNGRRRILYYPGKGFSPCCGPLVFDELSSSKLTCSEHPTNNELHMLMQGKKFQKLFSEQGLATDLEVPFPAACDACVSLLGSIDHAKAPSLTNIISKNETQLIKVSEPVDLASLFALAPKFESFLLCFADTLSTTHLDMSMSLPTQIRESSQVHPSDSSVINLYKKLTVEKFPEYFSLSTEDPVEAYIQGSKTAHTKAYFKDNELVAILVFNHREKYSYVQRPGLHIGFLGLHPSLLTKSERNAIKVDFVKTLLAENRRQVPFSAAIDYFNLSSYRFFTKLGFRPEFILFEPRQK